MDGVAEVHHLPVDAALAQFFLEGGDIRCFDKGIVGSVEDEEFGADVFPIGWGGGIETAVKTDGALDGSTAAGEFENGGAAEAETDGGDAFFIGEGVFLEFGEPRLGAAAQESAVGLVFSGFCSGLCHAGGPDSFAVNIGGESDVAHAGEFLDDGLGVGADAEPVVDDEDCWAWGLGGVVVGNPALESGGALLVFDLRGFDFGEGGQGECEAGGEGGADGCGLEFHDEGDPWVIWTEGVGVRLGRWRFPWPRRGRFYRFGAAILSGLPRYSSPPWSGFPSGWRFDGSRLSG
ncbi:MAG: hypothetical protein RLZZ399_838 [Verrucomicrobiota bacterium]